MNQLLVKDDVVRQEALEDYGLTNPVRDNAIDDLLRLAAQLCAAPIAAVALAATDGLSVISRIGPGPARLPLGNTPYELTLRGNTVLEVADARYHPGFAPDGFTVAGRTYRFYAGAPLLTPAGTAVGILFVQDSIPHHLSPQQLEGLAVLGRQVVAHFELNNRIRQMDEAGRAQQRVESALTVERNFVSTVLDTVGALVAVYDTAGRIVRFNRTCEVASGYEFESLVGRYIWEKLIPTADVPEAIESFERLRSGKFPASFENQWLNRAGNIRRIAWTATALVDSQGQPTFIIATGIDVTIQRAAEATLRESEARYRQLVEGSLGIICTHDMKGTLLSVNTYGAQSLGYTVDEMSGKPLLGYMPDERHHEFNQYLREVTDTGVAQGLFHMRHRGGEVRVIAFRNKRIETASKIPYVLGFGVDITEQVRAEEKLRTLIRESNSVLESVGDGIYGLDLQGRVTVVNPAAAQMLGYKPQELLGRQMHEIIHHTRGDGTPYPATESPIAASIAKLDTVRVADEIFWRKDGTSFPVEYVARPQIDTESTGIIGPDGRPSGQRTTRCVGVVVAFTDTTERRALDRMKDEFISTVSHELRTPLTSLRAALGLVSGGALATRPEKMQQMLEIAIGNTDRLARLVNDILDIERISSGKAELHFSTCNADNLLRLAAGQHQAAAAKSHLHFNIQANGVQVWADPDRIVQTLSNLISNAVKFSPVGGEILLTARQVDDHEAQFDVHDQGSGVPASQLENIFNRFQQVDASDSRIRGGTGLGLAICRSIVHQHGGHIWASSPPGDGATFHFTLPTRASQRLG